MTCLVNVSSLLVDHSSLSHFCCCLCLGSSHFFLHIRGPIFEKSYDDLTKYLWKVWLTKNLGWARDYQKILQKSYEKLRTKLCKTYEKLTTTLQVSYEHVKFTASDVIRETVCRRLLLVEYFWAKNNWQIECQFPKNALKKWLTIF